MADARQVKRLCRGVAHWNDWRKRNPHAEVDLSGIDLADPAAFPRLRMNFPLFTRERRWVRADMVDLGGIDLCDAVLNEAKLQRVFARGACLRGAKLVGADLADAILWEADADGAFFNYAALRHADFGGASLRGASLFGADLRDADFHFADVTGTDFRMAVFGLTEVAEIRYRRRKMAGKFLGATGLEGCYGSTAFRRDALDQEAIDSRWHGITALLTTRRSNLYHPEAPETDELSLKSRLPLIETRLPRGFEWMRWLGIVRVGRDLPRFLFLALVLGLWKLLTNHGRSISRMLVVAFLAIVTFGFAAEHALASGDISCNLEDTTLSPDEDLIPAGYYLSAMAFATLDIVADCSPITTAGQILLLLNVVCGYFSFGVVLAVFSTRISNR